MMRKAQSAADFRAYNHGNDSGSHNSLADADSAGIGGGGGVGGDVYSSRGSRGSRSHLPLDLGVLTPFYSVETGTFVPDSNGHAGGLGGLRNGMHKHGAALLPLSSSSSRRASHNGSGSGNNIHTLRASASHAALSGAVSPPGGAGPQQAHAYGAASSNGSRSAAAPWPAAPLRHASSSSRLCSLAAGDGGPSPPSLRTSASTASLLLPSSGSSSTLSSHPHAHAHGHPPHHSHPPHSHGHPSHSRPNSRAPLITHFSLSSLPKSNGQPRVERAELAMLTEKLRDVSFEVSRLHRRMEERSREQEQWSVRYARRTVLVFQAMLAAWAFVSSFVEAIRARRVEDSWLHRRVIPSRGAYAYGAGVHAASAASAAASMGVATAAAAAGVAAASAASLAGRGHAKAASSPLSAVLLSGCLTGAASALPFLFSFLLQLRSHARPRNLASGVSSLYSLLLLLPWRHRPPAHPRLAHAANVTANMLYVCTRYYFLHGLRVFNDMRIL